MAENFDKQKEVLYKFHITYNNEDTNDKFVRGHNVVLEYNNIISAIIVFQEQFPSSEILGILKSEVEK